MMVGSYAGQSVQPIAYSAKVSASTVSQDGCPEVDFKEVTWTRSRHLGDVLRPGLIPDHGEHGSCVCLPDSYL